jgi:hypothetical protein
MRSTISAICLLSLLLILPCGLDGQAAGDVSPGSANNPIVLPLDYTNKHLFVTLSNEKLGVLSMLVDTGTERTSISKPIAENNKVHKSFWRRTLSLNGYGAHPPSQEWRTVPVALHSGQTPIFSNSALVFDFGDLSKRLEHPLDGILGWDFFERWCITLDFSARNLTLRNLSECAPPAGKHGTLKGEWSAHGLLLLSVLTFPNGRSAPALLHLDTGSDGTLILNTQFRAIAGLGEKGTTASETKGFGLNGDYGGDIVPISGIEIEGGTVHLNGKEETTVLIGRRGSFSKAHWWTDGIGEAKINRDGGIGNGILEHLTWTFDPGAKRVYVEAIATSSPSKAR